MSLVVGIDIGNENCVVSAISKNGVADVVLNEASNRETPLLIHFDKKQRFFGSAGAFYASRNPKATFTQIKRLIGRRFDEPSFQKERHLLPYDTFEGPNGEIIVRVEFAGKPWEFTAVELLGMFLCYLSKSVKELTGSQISECVLGVPSYLTIQQRKDYLLAAEIAGLKPRQLFYDGAATAREYALSRDLPYGEAIHVVFVDIGHCDTQVTVVRFCFGTSTVLAHSFDRDLGGRNFDDKIFEHLAGVIQEKHSINVSGHVKASFRLRTACGKAKMVLSVNTEASVSMVCLMNDMDVDEIITRADFENMSSDLLKGVVNACKKALEDAGLCKEEIHSIELVGSGSRIPMISQVLEDFFGPKMRRTVNGSECIANGCALQCAMLCQMPPITRTFGVVAVQGHSKGTQVGKFLEVLSHTGCGVVERALGKENELEFHDKSNERAKNLRNVLEDYLIHLRSVVSAKSFKFASEEDINIMLKMLEDTECWLYGTGADETEQTYFQKQQKLHLDYQNLCSQHTIAEQCAGVKRNELCAYAHKIRQLYRRHHNLKEEEKNALKSKLCNIEFMMKEHDLRSQEEYIKKIEELKLIHDNITNRLKFEAAEKSKPTIGWSPLTWFAPGANQEDSNINNQAGMDSMLEPSAAIPTDGVPNRDDQVGSVPVYKLSVPNGTDKTLKNEPQALNSEILISYPEIRDEYRILYQPRSETALESQSVESRRPMNEQKNSNRANMVTQQSTEPIADENTYSNKGNTSENISASSEHGITQGARNISTRQTGQREGKDHGASSSQNRTKRFELTLLGTLGKFNVTCREDSLIADLKDMVLQKKGRRPDNIVNHERVIYPDNYTIKSFGFSKGFPLYYEFASV